MKSVFWYEKIVMKKSDSSKKSEGINSTTNLVALEVGRVDRLLDVLGNHMQLNRSGPTALEPSVRVAGREPIVCYLESLAAKGIRACRVPVPLHPDVVLGSSCNLVRREDRSPGRSVSSNP